MSVGLEIIVGTLLLLMGCVFFALAFESLYKRKRPVDKPSLWDNDPC